MKHCLICQTPLRKRHVLAAYCLGGCADKANGSGGASQAHRAVQKAIKAGDLPAANTLTCVDCGTQARDYDHRDYSRPLDVQPVCRSCNKKRGPAKQVDALCVPRARVPEGPVTHAA